jgi:hypothetical protein
MRCLYSITPDVDGKLFVPGSNMRGVRLYLAVCLVFLTTACQRQPSPTVFLDPALAVLVPRDTTLIAGIRMQRLKATPFYDSVVAGSPRRLEFRKTSGLTDDSDVWEYLIAYNGQDWLALMRGKFAEMGMEPRLDKPTARRVSYNGVTIIGDDAGAVAFLNPTTALAGRYEMILRTLDERNSNTGVPLPLEKLALTIPAVNEIWFASIGPMPGFVSVEQIKTATGGLNPKTRTLEMRIETDSAATAQSVAKTIDGQVQDNRVVFKGPIPKGVLDWIQGVKR